MQERNALQEANTKQITEDACNILHINLLTLAEQSIQAEVTKPTEPPQEVKTDPSKTPDGQKVDKVTSVEHDKVIKPENTTSADTPKSGDKKDGKIYVPGFGWIDDNGGRVQQNDVGSDGDINKQVGNMD